MAVINETLNHNKNKRSYISVVEKTVTEHGRQSWSKGNVIVTRKNSICN